VEGSCEGLSSIGLICLFVCLSKTKKRMFEEQLDIIYVDIKMYVRVEMR
jgi:hypothetical protein